MTTAASKACGSRASPEPVSQTSAGAPATPAAYGTEATIEDFGTGSDGLLTMRLRGGRRFHVQRTRVRDNGLVVGEVDWCPPEDDDELRPEHGLLATVLEKIFEKAGATPPGMTEATVSPKTSIPSPTRVWTEPPIH